MPNGAAARCGGLVVTCPQSWSKVERTGRYVAAIAGAFALATGSPGMACTLLKLGHSAFLDDLIVSLS